MNRNGKPKKTDFHNQVSPALEVAEGAGDKSIKYGKGDRWSYLYLEMGTLDQTAAGLVYRNKNGDRDVPINQLSVVLLGPGTTITHAAVKALAQNNCLLAWVGQNGVRLYAHSTRRHAQRSPAPLAGPAGVRRQGAVGGRLSDVSETFSRNEFVG
jgi:hypothetical protein